MKTLFELCKPRESVFNETKREDTLDLDNLRDGSINAKEFFEETYITSGMDQLLDAAFRRFSGKGATGLIRLTQAMGGGKTHNMIALGLLAKNPGLRKQILGDRFETLTEEIKVITFTGRESDIPYGIWGEIAAQLGKQKLFEKYYVPLSAPGQTAWIELLKGQPLLIMLDELPPYLDYMRTKQVGSGTMADITVNALSNLFNAVNKAELSNVCIVVSDLRAIYESGSGLLEKAFRELDNEISRTAMNIEPVRATSDDLYMILKKKLFNSIPSEAEIKEIALEYKSAVNKARQMGITGISAEIIFSGIVDSYPFHPCIKDLFARFKENLNFQQTRGFIRLTRLMIRHLFEGTNPRAKSKYLINANDYDLNQGEMFSTIKDIKPKLVNAISHDITSEGRAAAEEMDAICDSHDVSEISKMILMASLGDVSGVLLGLSEGELIGNLVDPNKDVSSYKKLLGEYRSKAWYLYEDKDNRLFYKDIKNVNAELVSIIDSFSIENAKQEIKVLLESRFTPKVKDCYQNLLVFPAIDEIELSADKVSLILFEPNLRGGGLHPDLQTFYDSAIYKNRVMFLSGQRNTMDNLLESAKEHRGITTIIKRMKNEDKVPESDTQYQQAQGILDRVKLRIESAIKETFVTLFYPTKDGIKSHQIEMNFSANNFDPEVQIRNLLADTVKKFEKDTSGETFRKKIEARIFTAPQMLWKDVLQRAATNTAWNWHHPSALNDAKDIYIGMGVWVENGGMVDKNPPAPETTLSVREVVPANDQGEATLKIIPQNGDTIYWEIGQPATEASSVVTRIEEFKVSELVLYFLCTDSTKVHSNGASVKWTNIVKVRYGFFDKNGSKYCELKANNKNVKIKYTTDGSNPKTDGATYIEPFVIPNGSKILQAITYNSNYDLYGELLQVSIPDDDDDTFTIDKQAPLTLSRKFSFSNSKAAYDALEGFQSKNVTLNGIELNVQSKNSDQWIDVSCDKDNTLFTSQKIKDLIDTIRSNFMSGVDTDVVLSVKKIHFNTGEDFEDWVASRKEEIKGYQNDIVQ